MTIFSMIQTTAQNEGFLAFYKGIIPALLDIIPYVAISIGGYDYLYHIIAEQYILET